MKRKPDHGVLLEKFGMDNRRRPALRRTRGDIGARCRLPDLPKLLEIDAQAEAAAQVAQQRERGGTP